VSAINRFPSYPRGHTLHKLHHTSWLSKHYYLPLYYISFPKHTFNENLRVGSPKHAHNCLQSRNPLSTKMSIPVKPTSEPNVEIKETPSLPPEALDLAAKLFDYARNGDNTSLTPYLQAGIPSNLTNHEGNTLLMLASYNGQAQTVSLLLSKSADPNVLNQRGQSPIAGAVFKGYDEIVKLLFEAGADVNLGQPNAVDCARMFKKGVALGIMGINDE